VKNLAIAVIALLAIVTTAVVASRTFSKPAASPEQPIPAPVAPLARPSQRLPSGIQGDQIPGARESAPPGAPGQAPSPSKDRVLDRIQIAATTYDPAQLSVIEPYLYHADPEIRAAALDGVVLLGDGAGAKLLRTAAGKTTDPSEALRLKEMADYLDLPPLPTDSIVSSLKAAKKAQDAASSSAKAKPTGAPDTAAPGK